MRSSKLTAPLLVLLFSGLAACLADSNDLGPSGERPSFADGRVPPAPSDCRPGPDESAYWLDLRMPVGADEGPRMAELVLRHPAGVSPQVSGLSAARDAQKALHIRPKGEDRTRVVILSSDNLNPLSSGPLACLKVPEGSELTLVRSQSEFAPSKIQPEPEILELWPVEVRR